MAINTVKNCIFCTCIDSVVVINDDDNVRESFVCGVVIIGNDEDMPRVFTFISAESPCSISAS
ncbi:MAG TPA: hypothetical protein VJL60_02165, partial [Gammaproteobacteria bacterium]|nr:hypothetical protein [Gammaproteobacteria bacterium]